LRASLLNTDDPYQIDFPLAFNAPYHPETFYPPVDHPPAESVAWWITRDEPVACWITQENSPGCWIRLKPDTRWWITCVVDHLPAGSPCDCALL